MKSVSRENITFFSEFYMYLMFSIILCSGGGGWLKSGTSGKVCPGQILFCLRRNFPTHHLPRDNEGFSGEGGDAETIFAKIFTFSILEA